MLTSRNPGLSPSIKKCCNVSYPTEGWRFSSAGVCLPSNVRSWAQCPATGKQESPEVSQPSVMKKEGLPPPPVEAWRSNATELCRWTSAIEIKVFLILNSVTGVSTFPIRHQTPPLILKQRKHPEIWCWRLHYTPNNIWDLPLLPLAEDVNAIRWD